MAKKKAPVKNTELDGKEFFAALDAIEKEKNIPQSYMMEKITQALIAAYKKGHEGIADNVVVEADRENCQVRMFVKKDVVETVDNPGTEMSLADARAALPRAQLGDVLRIEVKPKNFGRIAAQTARQVIIQGMREAERGLVYSVFSEKEHDLITGIVTRIDPRNGAVTLRVHNGSEATEALLAPGEQIRGEMPQEGERMRVYVLEVRQATRGPQVLVSRSHPGLVKRLFELEVPEIFDGTVQIINVAREAGNRTKVAVWSDDPNVDSIGACVGPKGARVNAIVEELGGEKIDIIKWSEDISQYVAAALAPATVLEAVASEDGKSCHVVAPDNELSLAIGKEGQNARLAAKLTGCRIDIRPASAPEPPEEDAPAEEDTSEEGPAEDITEEETE